MSLKTIDKYEETGGWLNLQFATLEELIFCPEIVTNKNANTIQIEGSEDTIDIVPIPERFMVNVTPRKTKQGTFYNISITLDFPYQAKDIDDYLNIYKNKKGIVIGTTTNSKIKMFGSKNHPLNFSYQEINGKKLEDSSITRINIKGNIPQKPVYIS